MRIGRIPGPLLNLDNLGRQMRELPEAVSEDSGKFAVRISCGAYAPA